MNKKYLEALDRLYKCNDDDYTLGYQQHDYKLLQQALQRLEAIDNANPSEALDRLEETNKIIHNYISNGDYDNTIVPSLDIIKQSLIKSQEQEKVLSIIKEYQVDVWLLKQCDYENYIRIRKEAMVSVGQIVNEDGIILEDEIPQEEFELLKEYFK